MLFGRSLIYRWAVVLPYVLAYQQKAWPYSPGLLRRIVRRNLEFHWELGAFDARGGQAARNVLRGGQSRDPRNVHR